MADNFNATAGDGTVVGAADDIGGVKYPRVKVTWGSDGTATDTDAANPLPVTLASGSAVVGHVIVDSGSIVVTNAGTFATQATQAGTWNITNVSGTVSLPTGASTAAKQPALGTAGTPSADVITIQGRASMTPVLVDGSAVTQPISGSISFTAPQHVIVDSGTITAVTAITNALPAGSNVIGHVIVDSGTITAVTAITNALPAGSNVIGHVIVDTAPVRAATTDSITAKLATDSIQNGLTALTPKFAKIAVSSSGANTIIAAVGGKKLRVLAYTLMANGAVNAKWQSHVTPTDLTGLKYFDAAGAGISVPFSPVGWFETISGEALDLNLSGGVAVGGELVYIEV